MNTGQYAIVGSIVGITMLVIATAEPTPAGEVILAVLMAMGAMVLIGTGGGHFDIKDVVTLDV